MNSESAYEPQNKKTAYALIEVIYCEIIPFSMGSERKDSPEQIGTLLLDTALDALADEYRRHLLVTLLEHNPLNNNDLQILAEVMDNIENLEQLKIAMFHLHLPQLEDAGFIEWKREANIVKKGPQFENIEPLLELMCDNADELLDE